MNLRETINPLPYPIKWGFKYIYGLLPPRIRFGRVFWETYNFLQESQRWNREKLEEYQMQQLSRLLRHVYENVPYYRKNFDECGINPKNIQNFNDFKKVPYLTKDTVKEKIKDLLARNFNPGTLRITHTSGTTGKPLQFFEDPLTAEKEWAFICHQWSRVGYKPGDLRVELRGPVNRNRPVWYDPALKVLHLSPLLDSKEKAAYYLDKIQNAGAKFLHGYPGAIVSFAFLIKRYGFLIPFSLRAIFFASEVVYPWQRELVKEVFGCRIFSHYGLTEKVVLAAECEHTTGYHCIPQYGLTEIDPDTREIIGTGFINDATPFIRYRTTDVASVPISLNCEKCKRNYYPVFPNIEGRLEDFIVTPRGALVSPAIITHPFKDLTTIKDTQVVQKDIDLIIVRVVPNENNDSEALQRELSKLCQDLQIIIGESVQVRWEIVEKIERLGSGKFKWIVSEVSCEMGCSASVK